MWCLHDIDFKVYHAKDCLISGQDLKWTLQVEIKKKRKVKNLFTLSVRISSYGCKREVWRARKMRKICTRLSPRATLAS